MDYLVQNMLRLELPVPGIARELSSHYPPSSFFFTHYDKLLLTRLFNRIDISTLRHIAIDKFVLEKKEKDAPVVIVLDTSRDLEVDRNKSQNSIAPFFEWLVKNKIFTVSRDMNAAHPSIVKQHLYKGVHP